MAVRRLVMGALVVSKWLSPTKSSISSKRNGEESDHDMVYLPGRNEKKKANAVMSATARLKGRLEASAIAMIC